MKVQTFACISIAYGSAVLTSARTIRGSDSNSNQGDTQIHRRASAEEAEDTLFGPDDNEDNGEKPYRVFNYGVEPQFRTLSYDEQPHIGPQDVAEIETTKSLRDPRIIGGQVASTQKYKYSVSLQDSIGHFCGGSLICPDVVLTAA